MLPSVKAVNSSFNGKATSAKTSDTSSSKSSADLPACAPVALRTRVALFHLSPALGRRATAAEYETLSNAL